MKKLFTLCLLAVTMCAVAQDVKKVAVYVTGEDNPMNQILGDRLVDGIAQSGKYKAVERTASFLQELSKEQDYQRSGNVDEADISRLGKQFGVDYVCVATILDVWNEKYLTSRLIDVETAEVVASSSSSGQIASSQQFIAAMNTLSNGLLNTLAQAQEGRKKVAVYVTRTGNKDVDIILGDKLVAGFAQSGRFCAIERTNGFLKQLGKEQGYQQSGAVDDDELTRLGKQFGVDYVCIAKTSALFGDYYITSRLIDVETGEVANSDKAEGVTLNTSAEVVTVAQNIAKTLSGMTIKEQEAERLKAEQEAQKRAEIARQEQLRREEEARLEAERKAAKERQFLQGLQDKYNGILQNGYFLINVEDQNTETYKLMVNLQTKNNLSAKDVYKASFNIDGYSWRMADSWEVEVILDSLRAINLEQQIYDLPDVLSAMSIPKTCWGIRRDNPVNAILYEIKKGGSNTYYDEKYKKNITRTSWYTGYKRDNKGNFIIVSLTRHVASQDNFLGSVFLVREVK